MSEHDHKHDAKRDAEAVSNHPRAMGAPSGSINDAEYRNAAIERGGGVDDPENPATEEGFPVPVIKKTGHAEALHQTARHDVATTDQAIKAPDLVEAAPETAVKTSDPFGGTLETEGK